MFILNFQFKIPSSVNGLYGQIALILEKIINYTLDEDNN